MREWLSGWLCCLFLAGCRDIVHASTLIVPLCVAVSQRDGTVLSANMRPFYLEKRLASPENRGESFHVFTLLLVAVLEGLHPGDMALGACPDWTLLS